MFLMFGSWTHWDLRGGLAVPYTARDGHVIQCISARPAWKWHNATPGSQAGLKSGQASGMSVQLATQPPRNYFWSSVVVRRE